MHPSYNGSNDPFPPSGPYSSITVTVTFNVTSDDSSIKLGTDESYTLQVTTTDVSSFMEEALD